MEQLQHRPKLPGASLSRFNRDTAPGPPGQERLPVLYGETTAGRKWAQIHLPALLHCGRSSETNPGLWMEGGRNKRKGDDGHSPSPLYQQSSSPPVHMGVSMYMFIYTG